MQTIQATKVFKWLCNSDKRINLLVGGAGSSKSHSIAQFILKKFYEDNNTRILVTRKTTPSLRISAYKLILDLLKEYGWSHSLNKTELTVSQGDNQILFKGLDDPEKIKSADFNYVWAEEATDLTLDDYRQLNLRLRRKTDGSNQMFLSCNPISALHWIKTELVDKLDIAVNHSTYKDNPFLDKQYVEQIKELINQDNNYYKIYALGEWGILEDIIYGNWQTLEIPEIIDDISYGVDYGFNNPSSLIKVIWSDNKVIWQEKIYEPKLTHQEFADKIKEAIPQEERLKEIFVDSASPELIQVLSSMGLNAHKAKKDVVAGINACKQHLKGVTADSVNLIKELQTYKWKQNKDNEVLDEPLKFMDHALDAGRYGTFSKLNNFGTAKNLKISFR